MNNTHTPDHLPEVGNTRTKRYNCDQDEALVSALAEYSENDEHNQWFINNHTGGFRKATIDVLRDENFPWEDWTKATPSEIVEFFKSKK